MLPRSRTTASTMPSANNSAARLLVAGLLVSVAGSASAQQPAPREPSAQAEAPAQSESPQRTTATYDDWVVQCETQAATPPEKFCDMAQVTQVQGKNLPFSRVVIAHPQPGQPVKLIVQVPVNASFATNVRVQVSDSDAGFGAPFARCLPAGCFAEFDIKDDLLKKLRAASGAGKISFVDASGHDIAVPLSFNGFDQAFDALSKE